MRHEAFILTFLMTALLVVGCTTSGTITNPASTLIARPPFHPPGYVRGSKSQRAKRVIIFVHGIIGDGTTTWTNPSTHAYFPELIATDETFAGVDVWVHEYDSPKTRRSYTIDELADHLRRYLNNDNVLANHEEIIFICHSMGGLVARAYLLKYHREIPPDRVRMMYFYSTPTTGSDIASLARLVSSNPQPTDMRKMTTDDAGVLGVWEAQWSSSPYAQTTLSYCAYELLPTFGIMVVQRESARHLCNTRPDPISRNHIEIVKPANNTSDESYVAFREAYRDTYERNHDSGAAPVWNLRKSGRALIEARNVTQTPYCENECWSGAVIVAPGDIVNVAVNYSNDGLVTARDARVRIDIPQAPILLLPLTATLAGTNVRPAFGQFVLVALTPVLLVPTQAWHETDNSEQPQPLLYAQSAGQVVTDGIRLGDIGHTVEPERVVVQFRCEPAIVVTEGDQLEKTMDSMLKEPSSSPSDEDLAKLLTPTAAGSVQTDEFGPSRWVSDVHDVHDDGSVFVNLNHFNNTDRLLRDLRARIEVTDETATSAVISINLRSAAGEIRTDTAEVHFRLGTTQRLRLFAAYRASKTLLQVFEAVASLKKGEILPEDPESYLPMSAAKEVLLGDLPPQTAIGAVAELLMGPHPSEPTIAAPQPLRTSMNVNVEHALLQVSNERHTREWKTQVAEFRQGDALAFAFYFKNTGTAIARDVLLKLALTSNDTGITAHGSLTAANADIVTGEAHVAFDRRKQRVRLYYDRAALYRLSSDVRRVIDATTAADGILLGDLDPQEWGWVKIMYVTAPEARDTHAADCAGGAAIPGKRLEFIIAADNPSHVPLRDVRLRVRFDHRLEYVQSVVTLTANGERLVGWTYRAITHGERVALRYRDAQVYTSSIGRHIDAQTATDSPVAVGDIPPNGQLLIRLVYDVMEERAAPCSGIIACPGTECSGDLPCQF